jgi:hypothetical protein
MYVAKSKHKSTEIEPIILKSNYDTLFFPHVNTLCFTMCTSENVYSYVSCKVTPLIQIWKGKVTHTSHICHTKNTYFGHDTNPQHCTERYLVLDSVKTQHRNISIKCLKSGLNEIHGNIEHSHEIRWNSSFTLNWNWYIFRTYGTY